MSCTGSIWTDYVRIAKTAEVDKAPGNQVSSTRKKYFRRKSTIVLTEVNNLTTRQSQPQPHEMARWHHLAGVIIHALTQLSRDWLNTIQNSLGQPKARQHRIRIDRSLKIERDYAQRQGSDTISRHNRIRRNLGGSFISAYAVRP